MSHSAENSEALGERTSSYSQAQGKAEPVTRFGVVQEDGTLHCRLAAAARRPHFRCGERWPRPLHFWFLRDTRWPTDAAGTATQHAHQPPLFRLRARNGHATATAATNRVVGNTTRRRWVLGRGRQVEDRPGAALQGRDNDGQAQKGAQVCARQRDGFGRVRSVAIVLHTWRSCNARPHPCDGCRRCSSGHALSQSTPQLWPCSVPRKAPRSVANPRAARVRLCPPPTPTLLRRATQANCAHSSARRVPARRL